jgi:TPR repeat protein
MVRLYELGIGTAINKQRAKAWYRRGQVAGI